MINDSIIDQSQGIHPIGYLAFAASRRPAQVPNVARTAKRCPGEMATWKDLVQKGVIPRANGYLTVYRSGAGDVRSIGSI